MPLWESFMTLTVKAAYVSVPLLLLKYAANAHPMTRYYFRLVLYVSTLSLCSVWGVLVSIGMILSGNRFDINYVVARSFYTVASRVMGITFNVEGEDYLREASPAVLVGNHQTMLDIIYLGRIFPKRASILAKKELQWMPFLGQYMSASGAVFIDRASNKNAVAALAAAGESMKAKGISLWIFPEGTRHSAEKSDMLPFKKGAFYVAVQAGVPIVPVVCENYWSLYHKGVLEPGKLKIKVLPPISTAGLTTADVPALMERTRETMLAALREISSHGPPSSPSETTPLLAQAQDQEAPSSGSDALGVRAVLPEGREGSSAEVKDVKDQVRAAAAAPPSVASMSSIEGSVNGSEDDGVLVDRP